MWNPFSRQLSSNTPSKRKRDEPNDLFADDAPPASRRREAPKTPTPRKTKSKSKSKTPSSARKENVRPRKSHSPATVSAAKVSGSSLFTGSDEEWAKRPFIKSEPVENESIEDLDVAMNGNHKELVASDDNAEAEEPEDEDIVSTIERDDDGTEVASEEADDELDEEDDQEYNPESESVEYQEEPESEVPEDREPAAKRPKVESRGVKAASKKENRTYRPDPREPEDEPESEMSEDNELAVQTPKVKNRGIKAGFKKDNATYRPDSRESEDEDEEVELPRLATTSKSRTPTKKPRAATTSSPAIRKEDFDRDVTKDDMMDVIPESDEEPESDWEMEGDELETYQEGIEKDIPSYNAWCREDKKLHKTLFLRGLHPLMPTNWKFDFLGYPITPEIFAPLESEKKVLIYNASENGQFRTTKALCGIFDLQGRVTALRQIGANDKISPLITKELNRYIRTVMKEAGLDEYDFAPTVCVLRIDNKKIGKKNVARTVEEHFVAWAEQHRKWYAERKLEAPRLLYGFVVVQHAVMLLTIDSARPNAKPRPFADFSMSAEQQWLDSSLNIAIPIFLARERLMQLAWTFPDAPPEESDHDDD